MNPRKFAVCCIAGLCVFPVIFGESAVALTVYNSRQVFEQAALGQLTREGFENEPVHTLTLPYVTVSGLAVKNVVGQVPAVILSNSRFFGHENTTPGGANVLQFGDVFGPRGGYTFSMTLQDPATAFGLDMGGLEPLITPPNGFSIRLLLEGSDVQSFFVMDNITTAPRFHGFINNGSFDEVVFDIPQVGSTDPTPDFIAVDEVTFNLVPEPATSLLGLAALAFLSWRQRVVS